MVGQSPRHVLGAVLAHTAAQVRRALVLARARPAPAEHLVVEYRGRLLNNTGSVNNAGEDS